VPVWRRYSQLIGKLTSGSDDIDDTLEDDEGFAQVKENFSTLKEDVNTVGLRVSGRKGCGSIAS
jgi:hypothetical protein